VKQDLVARSWVRAWAPEWARGPGDRRRRVQRGRRGRGTARYCRRPAAAALAIELLNRGDPKRSGSADARRDAERGTRLHCSSRRRDLHVERRVVTCLASLGGSYTQIVNPIETVRRWTRSVVRPS
jgi:hypothetical protein